MAMTSVAAAALCLAAAILLSSQACSAGDNSEKTVPGLVTDRPTAGRFVQLGDQWMVPYVVTIPDTDVTFLMQPIPGGEYLMGSPDSDPNHQSDETPQRRFRVEPFWMAECEVTWDQYKLFMMLYRSFKEFQSLNLRQVNEHNRLDAITAPTPLYEPDFTFEYGDDPRQPAVTMTQYAARQFSKWMTAVTGGQYRLPTEAEWEYACRAGSDTAWHFGDDLSRLEEFAWFSENSGGQGARLVRQKQPNPWGLFDMHGNVAEWVIDGYGPYAAADQPLSAASDWVRTDQTDPRVVRGGSWEFPGARCRSAARLPSDDRAWKQYDPNLPKSPWWYTTDPARGVGFRLVRPARIIDRESIEDFWKIDSEDLQFDVEDRLSEGRGVLGLVDRDLPMAIRNLAK